jgi:hypothetical protein
MTAPALTRNASYEGHPDISIPSLLKTGTFMTKVSEKKQKKVMFKLDPDEGKITYDSKKVGCSTWHVDSFLTASYLAQSLYRNHSRDPFRGEYTFLPRPIQVPRRRGEEVDYYHLRHRGRIQNITHGRRNG